MLRVIEYKGKEYFTKRKKKLSVYSHMMWYTRDDYIRFEWDTGTTKGHLDMQKYLWDKLPKNKKQLIYKLGEESK